MSRPAGKGGGPGLHGHVLQRLRSHREPLLSPGRARRWRNSGRSSSTRRVWPPMSKILGRRSRTPAEASAWPAQNCSSSSPAGRSAWVARTACLARRTASAGEEAIRNASRSTKGPITSGGMARLTRPYRSARSASQQHLQSPRATDAAGQPFPRRPARTPPPLRTGRRRRAPARRNARQEPGRTRSPRPGSGLRLGRWWPAAAHRRAPAPRRPGPACRRAVAVLRPAAPGRASHRCPSSADNLTCSLAHPAAPVRAGVTGRRQGPAWPARRRPAAPR